MHQLINLRKIAVSLAMFTVVVLGSFATAKADACALTQNNFGQSGSLGTITTTLITIGANAGQIRVDVALNSNYVIHSNDALGFNVASGFSGVTIVESLANFTVGNGGNFGGGFGSRAFSLDGQNTSTARANADQNFSFFVSTTTAGGFTNANQVTDFAVQIAVITADGATGFAACEPVTTPVPEPASMLLLGTGLVGVAAGLRRRRRALK